MDGKNNQFKELTLDQMEVITGGAETSGPVQCPYCRKIFIITSRNDQLNYIKHVDSCRDKKG